MRNLILAILLPLFCNAQTIYPDSEVYKYHTYTFAPVNPLYGSDVEYHNRVIIIPSVTYKAEPIRFNNDTSGVVLIYGQGNDTVWADYIIYKNPLFGVMAGERIDTLQVENYTNSYDRTPGNIGGGGTRNTSTDIRKGTDTDSTLVIGWVLNGEWIEFYKAINAGLYNISIRCATPNIGDSIDIYVDGSLVGSIDVFKTTGFNIWDTHEQLFILPDGLSIKFIFRTGSNTDPDKGFDINWITLERQSEIVQQPLLARVVHYLIHRDGKWLDDLGKEYDIISYEGYDGKWIILKDCLK